MTAQPHDLTLAEFIAWEARQEAKHEFADGRVYAFAGGTKRHAAIAVELLGLLNTCLRGSPCRVYGSDVLIAMGQSGRYADVVVTCDERDTRDLGETAVHYPKLIIEVLSDSTAAVDRGDKLDEYRTIDSLEEYVLVDSRRRWVEVYRRGDNAWLASLPMTDGELRLASVDATVSLEDLYATAGLALAPSE
jgi:Uma2 family endonuclease